MDDIVIKLDESFTSRLLQEQRGEQRGDYYEVLETAKTCEIIRDDGGESRD